MDKADKQGKQNNPPAAPAGEQHPGGARGLERRVFVALLLLFAFAVFAFLLTQFSQHPQSIMEEITYSDISMEPIYIEESPLSLEKTVDAGGIYITQTVFLGDSNTVRLLNYGLLEAEQVLAKEQIGIVDAREMAFVTLAGQGGRALTIVEALDILQPRRVVMTFGTNDIKNMTPNEFMREYRETLREIRKVYDGTIIINAIPPVRRNCIYEGIDNKKVATYNYMLRHMCNEDGIPFLESGESIANANGWAMPIYTVEDGVHLSEKGGEIILHYIRTHAYYEQELLQEGQPDAG